MVKDDWVYVRHMVDAMKAVERYVDGVSVTEFIEDSMCHDAVTRQVQVICEAARQISEAFQKKHKSIPWKDIIGMRHRLVHDYLEVDVEAVYDVVVKDIPSLKDTLISILPD